MRASSNQICDDVVVFIKHVKVAMGAIAERYELTQMQLYVINSIARGADTMGHVANNMNCDASNVTGIIDRLVVMGLVVRGESERDRRTRVLGLTQKGKDMIEKITDELPGQLRCDRLTNSERRYLHDIISRLTDNSPAA